MGGCAAINCNNHSRKNYRMFKFPKDPVRRKIWTIKCRRDNWVPGEHAQLCSAHFEENQFEQNRADNWKRLKLTAIPTLFNYTNLSPMVDAVPGNERAKSEILLKAPTNCHQSLKMDDSLVPGNAYIVKVVPATSENQELIKQEDDMEEEKYGLGKDDEQENDMEEHKFILRKDYEQEEDDDEAFLSDVSDDNVSEEESDPCIQEETLEQVPETEVVTYLFCDTKQKLNDIQKLIPGLAQGNSVSLSENFDLKEASKVSGYLRVPHLKSKNFKTNSKSEKADPLYKIAFLERKLEHFRKQRQIDKNKVKTLFQAQRRHLKKIDALKKCLAALNQQKAENINTFTLLDLLDGPNHRNLDNPNEYSPEARKFARELYAISREAYLYVRNKFNKVLPHDRTVTKWAQKEKLRSQSSDQEEYSDSPSSSKTFNMQVDCY